jgi:hypothetical protein
LEDIILHKIKIWPNLFGITQRGSYFSFKIKNQLPTCISAPFYLKTTLPEKKAWNLLIWSIDPLHNFWELLSTLIKINTHICSLLPMILSVILDEYFIIRGRFYVYEVLEISTSLASGLARCTRRDVFLWDYIFRKYSRKVLRLVCSETNMFTWLFIPSFL